MRDYPKYIKPYVEIIEEFEYSLSIFTKELDNPIVKGLTAPYFDNYYRLFPNNDIETIHENLATELNRKYVLELTASFEAKTAHYLRYVLKRNSEIGKKIPGTVRSGGKHLMYHHIISIFKDHIHPMDSVAYAEFKNLVDYRNWLAHGRGWDLEPHLQKFDFQYSWQIISSLFNLIPDYPDSLKN